MHYACTMKTMTIRNIPEPVLEELSARAARGGRSLQEFVLRHLVELTSRPDRELVLARMADRVQASGAQVASAEIVSWTREDRDRR